MAPAGQSSIALYSHLPVNRGVYRLILRLSDCARDFSREYRRALGQDLKRDSTVLVRMTTTGGLRSASSFTMKR